MRTLLVLLFTILPVLSVGCGNSGRPATPVETLKAYTIALRNKDTTMMKLLLSDGTIKTHQDEANARGVTLDEIVQQQALFPADQRVFDYRNQKIEGEKATVEVKNSFGGWDVVFLVKEGGAWKIDKKGTADNMIDEIEKQNELLDQQIDEGRIDTEESPLPSTSPSPDGSASPGTTPQPPSSTQPAEGATPANNPPAQIN